MTKTTASRVFAAFNTTADSLGLERSERTKEKLFRRAFKTITNGRNSAVRRDITNIGEKPYANRDGEQEAFNSIYDTDRDWAITLVHTNRERFQAGVEAMDGLAFHMAVRDATDLKVH